MPSTNSLYPLTLTYSFEGTIMSIFCKNQEQADIAFHDMFKLCGHEVKYSVD